MSEPVARKGAEPQRFGRYEVLLPLEDDGFVSSCIARVRGPTVGPRIAEFARVAKGLSHEAEVRAAFFAEARAAGRIRHVNFVHPTETLVHEGDLFRATEFVLGVRLDELLAAVHEANSSISVGIACRIALDVLAGLSAVHATPLPGAAARPLVHGDIAPTNIVISYRGTARLVHSGLSVAASRIGAIDRRNRRLAYKAPEQLRAGVRAVPIGPGADLFAVGIILWEMISGRRLFDGPSDLETVERVLNAPVPSPQSPAGEHVPPELATLVTLALDRSPDRPTTSAADFGDALEQAAGPLLPGDEVVGLAVDRFLGPRIDQIREQIQARLDEVDASSEEQAQASIFGPDVPPSSGVLLDRRQTSSGRLRAQTPFSRSWSELAYRSYGPPREPSTWPSPLASPGPSNAPSSLTSPGPSTWPSSLTSPGPSTAPSSFTSASPLTGRPASHVNAGLGSSHAPATPTAELVTRAKPGAERLGFYVAVGAVIGVLVVFTWVVLLPRLGVVPFLWLSR